MAALASVVSADHQAQEFWDGVWSVFDEAIELGTTERASLLETRCTGKEQMRTEVQRMLDAHAQERGLLDEAALAALRADRTPITAAQLPDLTGQVLSGRYELTRVLERGGAGVVYVGVDRTDDRRIAVKVLPPSPHGHWRQSRAESATLRMLRVAGVVRLLDDGRVEEGPGFEYLVTEFVDGSPFPGRKTPCRWGEIATTTRALLETLDRIHWAGILHRDLKPGNVLVRPDGTPVVLDLGISQQRRESALAYGPTVGTPRYLAPEQLTQGAASIQSDLYAVGVMLQEALVGEPPSKRSDERQPLARLAPDVPPAIAELIDRLCRVDPLQRPLSATQALQVVVGEVPKPRPRYPDLDASSVDALRALFAGHDRLLHIPEDAAREVANRTDGTRDDTLAELDAWERAGLGRWRDGKFHIDRRGIETLRAGLRVSPPRIAPLDDTQPPLENGDTLLLVTIMLARAEARLPLLASALDQDEVHLSRRIAALTKWGYLAEAEDGYLRIRQLPSVAQEVLVEQSRGIHRRLARSLPVGSEARIQQFVAADEMERVPAEALEAARAQQNRGALPRMQLLLAEALKALEVHPDADAEEALVEFATLAAVQSGSPAVCDHLLFQLAARPPNPTVARLEAIARGAHYGYTGEYQRGLDALPALLASTSPLERRISASLRLFLARGVSPEVLEELIVELETLAEDEEMGSFRMNAAGGRAWLHYRLDEFEQAAAAHLAAAELTDSATTRASLRLNAASALLEAGALDRAEQIAEPPRDFALRARMPAYEARAEWIIRAARYRRGDESLVPDPALVHASRELGQRNQTALNALTEAAIAWRRKDNEAAREFADIAAAEWTAIRQTDPSLLARALGHAAGATLAATDVEEMLLELRGSTQPTTAIQTAGLLADGTPALAAACASVVEHLIQDLGSHPRDLRLEVTSIPEAMKSVALTP